MKFFKKFIEDKIEIDEHDWKIITSLFIKKSIKKGEELFSAGEVCQKLHYLSSGVMRIYTIDTQGKDLTMRISYNQNGYQLGPFVTDYVSYLTQIESEYFCEALSDCVIYVADFSELDEFYESDLKWMTLAKKISDMQLITTVQSVEMMKRLTAKEKYELMKVIAPVYEEVLPDYQFATFLGIAPQSLSRIKNNL